MDVGIIQVLNARPDKVEKESEVVAQAGMTGAVTVATNMAGRGTDILLGGNPSLMARLKLREALVSRVDVDVDVVMRGANRRPAWRWLRLRGILTVHPYMVYGHRGSAYCQQPRQRSWQLWMWISIQSSSSASLQRVWWIRPLTSVRIVFKRRR